MDLLLTIKLCRLIDRRPKKIKPYTKIKYGYSWLEVIKKDRHWKNFTLLSLTDREIPREKLRIKQMKCPFPETRNIGLWESTGKVYRKFEESLFCENRD